MNATDATGSVYNPRTLSKNFDCTDYIQTTAVQPGSDANNWHLTSKCRHIVVNQTQLSTTCL